MSQAPGAGPAVLPSRPEIPYRPHYLGLIRAILSSKAFVGGRIDRAGAGIAYRRSIVTVPRYFVPPRPTVPDHGPGLYGLIVALRTNALGIWPRDAYTKDVVVRSMLGRKRFLLNAPDAIHHVLVENIANYRRTPAVIRILWPITGDGLVLSEGEEWRHQRRTIAPHLAPRVIPMLSRHVAEVAEETTARLVADASQPVDLLAAMHFLALEVAARSMYSLEMNHYGPALRALITRFASGLGRPYFLDLILPIGIPTPRDLARRTFRAQWIRLMDEIFQARLREPPSDQPRDLFDVLLAARDPETGAGFSHSQLRDQMATMIVSGHETTALTMFWSLYLLASAPAEQERLAEEVRAIDLGADAAGAALASLPYTRAVVNEALRLYPPAFAVARVSNAADRAGEVAIPAGSLVVISPWVLHRHVQLWNDPDAFNPSRFLQDKPQAHRFAYMPFGAGPRSCVGAQFALAEAVLVLARLIQQFEIALADDAPVLPVAVFTTQPDRPVRFRLRVRNAGTRGPANA
jgi:cytochrome P450